MADHIGRAQGAAEPLLHGRKIVRRHGDSSFTVFLNDRLYSFGDFIQRLIPGNFLKFAVTAGTNALQGLFKAHRMIPNPHCLCSARAAAALRMGWIRHDAHRFLRNRRTFLMHGQKTAVTAADIAGARMRLPSVCLQSLNLFGKRLINGHKRRESERAGRTSRRSAA